MNAEGCRYISERLKRRQPERNLIDLNIVLYMVWVEAVFYEVIMYTERYYWGNTAQKRCMEDGEGGRVGDGCLCCRACAYMQVRGPWRPSDKSLHYTLNLVSSKIIQVYNNGNDQGFDTPYKHFINRI